MIWNFKKSISISKSNNYQNEQSDRPDLLPVVFSSHHQIANPDDHDLISAMDFRTHKNQNQV